MAKLLFPVYRQVDYLNMDKLETSGTARSRYNRIGTEFLELVASYSSMVSSYDAIMDKTRSSWSGLNDSQALLFSEFAPIKYAQLVHLIHSKTFGKESITLDFAMHNLKRSEFQFGSDGARDGTVKPKDPDGAKYAPIVEAYTRLVTIGGMDFVDLREQLRTARDAKTVITDLMKQIADAHAVSGVYDSSSVVNAFKVFTTLYYEIIVGDDGFTTLGVVTDNLLDNFVAGKIYDSFDTYLRKSAASSVINDFINAVSINKSNYIEIVNNRYKMSSKIVTDVVDASCKLLIDRSASMIEWSIYKDDFIRDHKRYKALYEVSQVRQNQTAAFDVDLCVHDGNIDDNVTWEDSEVSTFLANFNSRYSNIIEDFKKFLQSFFVPVSSGWRPAVTSFAYDKNGKRYFYRAVIHTAYDAVSYILKEDRDRIYSGSTALYRDKIKDSGKTPNCPEIKTYEFVKPLKKEHAFRNVVTNGLPIHSLHDGNLCHIDNKLTNAERQLWLMSFQVIRVNEVCVDNPSDMLHITYDVTFDENCVKVSPSYRFESEVELSSLGINPVEQATFVTEQLKASEVESDLELFFAISVKDLNSDPESVLKRNIALFCGSESTFRGFDRRMVLLSPATTTRYDLDYLYSMSDPLLYTMRKRIYKVGFGMRGDPIPASIAKIAAKQEFILPLRPANINQCRAEKFITDGSKDNEWQPLSKDHSVLVKTKPFSNDLPNTYTMKVVVDIRDGVDITDSTIRYDESSDSVMCVFKPDQIGLTDVYFDSDERYYLYPSTGNRRAWVCLNNASGNVVDLVGKILISIYTAIKYDNCVGIDMDSYLEEELEGICKFLENFTGSQMAAESAYLRTNLTWSQLIAGLRSNVIAESERKDAYVRFWEEHFRSISDTAVDLTNVCPLMRGLGSLLDDVYQGITRPLTFTPRAMIRRFFYDKFVLFDSVSIDAQLSILSQYRFANQLGSVI